MPDPLGDAGDRGGRGAQAAGDLRVGDTGVDEPGDLQPLRERAELVERADVAQEGEHGLAVVDRDERVGELLYGGRAPVVGIGRLFHRVSMLAR